MLAIFGWIVLMIIMILSSLFYLMICLNALPTYTIGGARTVWYGKVITLAIGYVLYEAWSLVLHAAPFTIQLS